MVLPQVDEVEDIVMPRLDVDGESTEALVAPLVDIVCSCVVCAEHRHDAICVAICAGNVGTVTRTGLEWE
jgi:hypothetical protein